MTKYRRFSAVSDSKRMKVEFNTKLQELAKDALRLHDRIAEDAYDGIEVDDAEIKNMKIRIQKIWNALTTGDMLDDSYLNEL